MKAFVSVARIVWLQFYSNFIRRKKEYVNKSIVPGIITNVVRSVLLQKIICLKVQQDQLNDIIIVWIMIYIYLQPFKITSGL